MAPRARWSRRSGTRHSAPRTRGRVPHRARQTGCVVCRARDPSTVIVESARGIGQRPTCPREIYLLTFGIRLARVNPALFVVTPLMPVPQPAQRLIRECHCSGARRRTAHGAAGAAAHRGGELIIAGPSLTSVPPRRTSPLFAVLVGRRRARSSSGRCMTVTLLLQCVLSVRSQAGAKTGTHLNVMSTAGAAIYTP